MIEVVSSEIDMTPVRVYNFEVANNQSYAVGELGAWAHNHKGDKKFGLPDAFWNWYHRKGKCKGDIDLPDKETADDWYKIWKDLGKPGPDNKGRRGGGH